MWLIYLLSIWSIIEAIHGLCREGCIFNGQAYKPKVQVQFGCFIFECTQSQDNEITYSDTWQFVSINGSCPLCYINNDPHFKTFDGHYYDFHGLCNYTISQPDQCCDVFSSYLPPYGIFGDFEACVYGLPGSKCLDITTYKISDDLSVQIKHTSPPSLEINGNSVAVTATPVSYFDFSYFSSVIVWKSGSNCVTIVGTHYSIVACNSYMIIYTVPENKNKIAGLCGFYSGTPKDDFRLRNCSYESLGNEVPFGTDWKTVDQKENICKGCFKFSTAELLESNCEKREEANNICESVIKRSFEQCPTGYSKYDVSWVIEDCIKDCCSTGMEYCEKWAHVGYEFLCTLSYLSRMTNGTQAALQGDRKTSK